MEIEIIVNGEGRRLVVEPTESLASVLREHLRLTGTKIGCGSGDCGACTVLVDGRAVCSCLFPAWRADGRAVTTIEGLASDGVLHPLQAAFVKHGALQCGFCSPGMIVSAVALLGQKPRPTEDEVVRGLAGNICRCTGYRKIIEAVLDAAESVR